MFWLVHFSNKRLPGLQLLLELQYGQGQRVLLGPGSMGWLLFARCSGLLDYLQEFSTLHGPEKAGARKRMEKTCSMVETWMLHLYLRVITTMASMGCFWETFWHSFQNIFLARKRRGGSLWWNDLALEVREEKREDKDKWLTQNQNTLP